MPLLPRGVAPGRSLLIRGLARRFVVIAALLVGGAVACSTDADDGAAAPQTSESTPAWWFADPCGDAPTCRPPLPAELPSATTTVEGDVDALRLDTEGEVVVGAAGSSVGLIEIAAPDVTVVGIEVDTIVIDPVADGASIEASRVGSLFVNGADGVVVRGNLIRPFETGPDAVQIKTFDGDQPENLLFEANVVGPQDSDGERHTDCVQVLGGDRLYFVRNVVLPCGDKALQIRGGAGGEVGLVTLEANAIYECPVQRPGCEGFHAIVWASTETSVLRLRHNTILGSMGISTSGSTVDPGNNFVAVGNIAYTLPCTDSVSDNLTVEGAPCEGRGVQSELPEFVDAAPTVGDVRLVDPTAVPAAGFAYGPGLDGSPICSAPRLGAATGCG